MTKIIIVGDDEVILEVWGTAPEAEYKGARTLFYPEMNAFIVCFSLVHLDSLENVENESVPEARQSAPNAPIVFGGVNSDLRDSFNEEWGEKTMFPIPKFLGESMKEKIGAEA
jgi:GTPase SAR1 family protein